MYKIHTLVFIRAAADINRLINFSAIDYDNQEPSFDGNKTIIDIMLVRSQNIFFLGLRKRVERLSLTCNLCCINCKLSRTYFLITQMINEK